jgi:hypothetical protein
MLPPPATICEITFEAKAKSYIIKVFGRLREWSAFLGRLLALLYFPLFLARF